MATIAFDELLDPASTASVLKTSVRTLAKLDIPKVRIGGRVFYARPDVLAWLNAQRSTKEVTNAHTI